MCVYLKKKHDRVVLQCLDVDPVGMTLALWDATCRVCGDGDIGDGEQCDAGDANSNEPDAPCRTNCMLPRCGDGVIDADEECDARLANSDAEDAYCHTDCTAVIQCDVNVRFTTLDGVGREGPTLFLRDCSGFPRFMNDWVFRWHCCYTILFIL